MHVHKHMLKTVQQYLFLTTNFFFSSCWQANPLRLFTKGLSSFISPTGCSQGSTKSLILPLEFTISDVQLCGEISVVMSKTKGATVVFQGSPLRSVEIRSSLDFLPGASDMLKQEINEELVLMFSDYIPDMLYKLSLENSPDSSVYERNLAELMIASKDRRDRTTVFSKDRSFPFLSDALLNSDNLKSVRTIRNSAQTLGLGQLPAGSGFDCDVVNSPACLSASPASEARHTSSASTRSESNKASATPHPSTLMPQQQQLARKQRRVISLRKNFNTYFESKQSSVLTSSDSSLQPGQAPQSSSSSSRRGSSKNNTRTGTPVSASSPLIPTASSSVTSSLPASASAPASILSSPKQTSRQYRHGSSPITPELYYPQHQYHDLSAIPSLDFHKHASVTANREMNKNNTHTTKHNQYTYHLQHQSHPPQQQHAAKPSDSPKYRKARTKSNVATPNQIFSRSSASAAAADVVIVGDDHFGKTGEPFYNVGSVSFNIPPPVYR